jgi:ribosome maturation factor RimP
MYLDKIKHWGEAYCEEHDLFLVKVEQIGDTIEVSADSMNNITIEECGKLSRYIQNKLEEEEEGDVLTKFSFNVSSPGMSNPLILPIQYRKRLGKKLEIITLEGREINGEVKQVDEDTVTLLEIIPKNKKTKEEEKMIEHQLNYNQIKKALIPIPTNFKKK